MPNAHGEVLEKWDIINTVYPVSGIKIYDSVVQVVRAPKGNVHNDPPENSKVTHLSRKSLSRLAFLVTASQVKFKSILTLTFEGIPKDGREVKAKLNHFLTYLRRRFAHYKLEYLWFLEFQKRGSPHFHIMLSISSNVVSRETILRKWVDITKGSKRAERVTLHKRSWEDIREREGAKRYALKYALKPEQKTVPPEYHDVGRFWGASRGVKPDEVEVIDATEDKVRAMIECVRPGFNAAMPKMLPKYIFLPDENLS